jgi:hypothetical protein
MGLVAPCLQNSLDHKGRGGMGWEISKTLQALAGKGIGDLEVGMRVVEPSWMKAKWPPPLSVWHKEAKDGCDAERRTCQSRPTGRNRAKG